MTYLTMADKMYNTFRESSTDVSQIAEQTGWDVKDIELIKKHLMLDEVEKWDGSVGLPDADYEIAVAWE